MSSYLSLDQQRHFLRAVNEDTGFPFKYLADNKTAFCKVCEKPFIAIQKCAFLQHVKSKKHELNKKIKTKRSAMQAQLEDVVGVSPKKSKGLCEAMLAANIPWIKLQNPILRNFLQDNLGITIQNESSLRNTYLPECYKEVFEQIRLDLQGSRVWISIDETTDSQKRYVASFLIGKLDSERFHAPYLSNCAFLKKADSSTMARFINDSLRMLWPNFDSSLLKVFVSDAAPYMVKCGKDLKVFYPDMNHITCIAHGVHRVAETVRYMFDDINDVISNVKQVFLKAPSRLEIWEETCPNLQHPPEPIVTRWGTWIEAALFYSENFDLVQSVVAKLDETEAVSIKRAKEALKKPSLPGNLAFIHANLAFIPRILKELQTAGLPLTQALEIVDEVKAKLGSIGGEKGNILAGKYREVLAKNSDLRIMQLIGQFISGTTNNNVSLPPNIRVSDIAHFKFCSIVSVDVERSFSIYKKILADDRTNFTEKSLSTILVCNMFYNRKQFV